MGGFVGRKDSSFPDKLKILERAAHLFPSDTRTIRCAKFGLTVLQTVAPPCYQAVLKPGFFALPKDQDKTKIEAVFSALPKDSLTIAITDLFEDEADQDSLFDSFATNVFKNRMALGIVAATAGFKGTIYDIGVDKGHREWDRDRPFYALVAGEPGNVEAYFAELASDIPRENLLILSDIPLRKPVSWDNARLTVSNGVALDRSYIRVDESLKPKVQRVSFGVIRMQRDDCRLDLTLDEEPVLFHPRILWNRVGVTTEVRRFSLNGPDAEGMSLDSGAVSSVVVPPTSPAKSGKGASPGEGRSLKPEAVQMQPPILRLSWQRPRIRPFGRVYVERVVLGIIPESADFSAFPFVKGLSATPERGKSNDFDGSKTQYLSELVAGLWKTLVQTEHPQLGSVYIYFEP